MTLGMILCLIVLLAALISFIVPTPDWLTMVLIALLAVAGLVSGVVIFKRTV